MAYLISGAAILGIGVLIGASISESNLKKLLSNNNDLTKENPTGPRSID